MKFKRTLSGLLALATLVLGTASTVGSVNAIEVETKDTPSASAATLQTQASEENSIDYKLCENIEDGVILHAWCWDFKTITEYMPDIAAAGFTAVQTSPANTCYSDVQKNMVLMGLNEDGSENGDLGAWWWQYQPIDWKIGNYQLGDEDDYKEMCEAAHNCGVKIITDIVPNHTTPHTDEKDIYENGPISSELITALGGTKLNDIYHTNGLIDKSKAADKRDGEINYENGGLPDMNTENPLYQQYLINYCNQLIADGCDGFRYDMAKHIALPSDPIDTKNSSKSTKKEEINNFWSVVTGEAVTVNGKTVQLSNSNLFTYGEILGDEIGKEKFEEYAKYIRVTSSTYGNTLRNAIKNKSFNAGSLMSWHYALKEDQIVTWVESHDTYCNEHESTFLTDWDIKMCWAVIAARKGGTPLFFSRPDGSDAPNGDYWGNNVLGAKGNDHFKDPEIAAVNKFRNAMAGQSEYLRNINDDPQLFQIDRGNIGTCIINLSDSDYDINTATSMKNGTYLDTVSGTVFTVSNGYIKGHIFAGKIATIYPPETVNVTANYQTSEFNDSVDVVLGINNAQSGTYEVIADNKVVDSGEFVNNKKLTIGNNLNTIYSSKEITLVLKTAGTSGYDVKGYYKFIKINPSDVNCIYFDNSEYKWRSVYAYIYDGTSSLKKWPGVQLTETVTDPETKKTYFKYKLPYGYRNAQIIFTESENASSNRYPADGESGLSTYGNSMLFSTNYTWEEYPAVADVTEKGSQDISTYSYVYFFNYLGWTEDHIKINLWNDSVGFDNGVKKYMSYSDDLHCYYFRYDSSAGFDKVKFVDGSKSRNETGELTLNPGKVYIPNESSGEWNSLENIEVRKIYFKKTNGWSKVNAYLWRSGSSANNGEWPGETMTNSGDSLYYSYTYYTPKNMDKYDKIIFNNGDKNSTQQTTDLNIQTSSNGESFTFNPGSKNSSGYYTGTWSKTASSKELTITLKYYDHKVGESSKTSNSDNYSNAQEIPLEKSINVSVTDGNLDKAVADAVSSFKMGNLYENYIFHSSQFEYIKTIASTTDIERINNNLTYAAKINPKYFAYQTNAFSGRYTEIKSLAEAMKNGNKWVTYKSGSSEILPENVKPDLSNISEVEVWGYSVPNTYHVELHYPTASSQQIKVKLGDNLYTAQYSTGMQPQKCYYNQLLNPGEENLTANMVIPKGYIFDGWYMINFKDNSYIKISSEKDFACRVTSNINMYAVFRVQSDTKPQPGAAATANNVDVFADGDTNMYRFNTILNIYNYDEIKISDVAVIYVKLDKNLNYKSSVDSVRDSLSRVNQKNGSFTIDGKTASYNCYTYSTANTSSSYVKLTNKNRLQFILTLTEDQKNEDYSNVLAFTAFKYNNTWKISDNCVSYQNGVPITLYAKTE